MSSGQHPFGVLVDLANCSLAQARGLPAQLESAPTWTGIGFVLSGQLMVAPMAEIAELMHMPMWAVMPGVKAWVKGVANVRGRLLPLIDLEAFFDGQLGVHKKSLRVLAVERNDLYTGLIVSEVIGMLHFPIDTYLEKIPKEAAPFAKYSEGSYVYNNKTWTVFSPHKLAMDGRFTNAAA